ncbi:MAG TPA: hypothetical protein VN030_13985 [Cellvibrio sp.]|nr:hypothetical protein [Cellvibrio sp.]
MENGANKSMLLANFCFTKTKNAAKTTGIVKNTLWLASPVIRRPSPLTIFIANSPVIETGPCWQIQPPPGFPPEDEWAATLSYKLIKKQYFRF